jgi:hypothetical protein
VADKICLVTFIRIYTTKQSRDFLNVGSNNKNKILLLKAALPCFVLAVRSMTCRQDKPTREGVARRLAKLFNLDKYDIMVMAFLSRLGKAPTFLVPNINPPFANSRQCPIQNQKSAGDAPGMKT